MTVNFIVLAARKLGGFSCPSCQGVSVQVVDVKSIELLKGKI
jgi:hypothetical protein